MLSKREFNIEMQREPSEQKRIIMYKRYQQNQVDEYWKKKGEVINASESIQELSTIGSGRRESSSGDFQPSTKLTCSTPLISKTTTPCLSNTRSLFRFPVLRTQGMQVNKSEQQTPSEYEPNPPLKRVKDTRSIEEEFDEKQRQQYVKDEPQFNSVGELMKYKRLMNLQSKANETLKTDSLNSVSESNHASKIPCLTEGNINVIQEYKKSRPTRVNGGIYQLDGVNLVEGNFLASKQLLSIVGKEDFEKMCSTLVERFPEEYNNPLHLCSISEIELFTSPDTKQFEQLLEDLGNQKSLFESFKESPTSKRWYPFDKDSRSSSSLRRNLPYARIGYTRFINEIKRRDYPTICMNNVYHEVNQIGLIVELSLKLWCGLIFSSNHQEQFVGNHPQASKDTQTPPLNIQRPLSRRLGLFSDHSSIVGQSLSTSEKNSTVDLLPKDHQQESFIKSSNDKQQHKETHFLTRWYFMS